MSLLDEALVSAPPDGDVALRRVRAALLSAKAPARDWRREVALMPLLSLVLSGVVAVALAATDNLVMSVLTARAGLIAGLVMVSCLASLGALVPRRRWLRALSGGAAVVALLALVALRRAVEGSSTPEWLCTATHVAVGLPPLLVGLLALRRTGPDLGRTVVMGLAAGTTGALVGELACARDGQHVAVFHVGAWLVVTVLAVVLQRAFRVSSYAP